MTPDNKAKQKRKTSVDHFRCFLISPNAILGCTHPIFPISITMLQHQALPAQSIFKNAIYIFKSLSISTLHRNSQEIFPYSSSLQGVHQLSIKPSSSVNN
jgi:hypothetical protein